MPHLNCFTDFFSLIFQELSPTSDTNLVRSLMNLIDCFMSDFADEVKVGERNDRETYSLLEVGPFLFESCNRKTSTAFPNAS